MGYNLVINGVILQSAFDLNFDHFDHFRPTLCFDGSATMTSYGNSGDWQPSPPWNETPLTSLQSLRGLLQSPSEALQQELPDSFPYVHPGSYYGRGAQFVPHIGNSLRGVSIWLWKWQGVCADLEMRSSPTLPEQRLQCSKRYTWRWVLWMAEDDQHWCPHSTRLANHLLSPCGIQVDLIEPWSFRQQIQVISPFLEGPSLRRM